MKTIAFAPRFLRCLAPAKICGGCLTPVLILAIVLPSPAFALRVGSPSETGLEEEIASRLTSDSPVQETQGRGGLEEVRLVRSLTRALLKGDVKKIQATQIRVSEELKGRLLDLSAEHLGDEVHTAMAKLLDEEPRVRRRGRLADMDFRYAAASLLTAVILTSPHSKNLYRAFFDALNHTQLERNKASAFIHRSKRDAVVVIPPFQNLRELRDFIHKDYELAFFYYPSPDKWKRTYASGTLILESAEKGGVFFRLYDGLRIQTFGSEKSFYDGDSDKKLKELGLIQSDGLIAVVKGDEGSVEGVLLPLLWLYAHSEPREELAGGGLAPSEGDQAFWDGNGSFLLDLPWLDKRKAFGYEIMDAGLEEGQWGRDYGEATPQGSVQDRWEQFKREPLGIFVSELYAAILEPLNHSSDWLRIQQEAQWRLNTAAVNIREHSPSMSGLLQKAYDASWRRRGDPQQLKEGFEQAVLNVVEETNRVIRPFGFEIAVEHTGLGRRTFVLQAFAGLEEGREEAMAKLQVAAEILEAQRTGPLRMGAVLDLTGIPSDEPVLFVGDLHGQVDNLREIVGHIGPLGKKHLVILGDGVHPEVNSPNDISDMGPSIQTMQFIFDLMVQNPGRVHYLVGNHDVASDLSKIQGVDQGLLFKKELERLYGKEYLKEYKRFIQASPLLAVGKGFAAFHLFPGKPYTLQELEAVQKVARRDKTVLRVLQENSNLSLGEVDAFKEALGQSPETILLQGHKHLDTGQWHRETFPQQGIPHHTLYAGRCTGHGRLGYAQMLDGVLSFIEIKDPTGLEEGVRSLGIGTMTSQDSEDKTELAISG